MSRRARLVLGSAAVAAIAALGTWAVSGLPRFAHPRGPYATQAPKAAYAQRHVTDTVTGVNFDLRGFDTLGEELILFVAALGSAVLLRATREEGELQAAARADHERGPRTAEAVRALGAALVGPFLLLGVYIVVHGHLTPGGGFQGGVVLAGALLLVYVAGQVLVAGRGGPVAGLEVADALGAASFALIAVGGLIFGGAALNDFLPLGATGQLLSGGTIPLLNVGVGVEVTGAVTLILAELLDQTLVRGPRR
jgi:multicomponent Na+:H+ antiporter subunit B